MNKLTRIIEEDAQQICSKVGMAKLQGKTIMITGASGLIGTYMVACLKRVPSTKVIAIMQRQPPSYFHDLLYKNGELFYCDLTEYWFREDLPKADYIIHAAGYAQPGKFMVDPAKTLKLNTTVTDDLMGHLAPDGRFLFISSGEVYSGLSGHHKETQIGTTNTTHPRSCYIEGKRCGEAICNAHRTKGINASSARVVLAYGPGTRPGDHRVLNELIEMGIKKGRITLRDSGTAKRTYCYVSDTVEILLNILLRGHEPIYNVGGRSRTTISHLARKIGWQMGVPVEIPKGKQGLPGAPDDVCLDMDLVRKEFKKTKYVPFDEGLARTIEWQKALYRIKP